MDIADALIHILVARGVKTVYGVPGDYAIGLFDRFEKCREIDLVCPAGEEAAAFAADAEAQLTGIGVCLVTFGVGALRVLNPVAGAFAEKSRVLVISGAPGMAERSSHPQYLHHVHKMVNTQMRIFREVCTEVGEISSSSNSVSTIHEVLDAMEARSLPGFLQVPRDLLAVPLPTPLPPLNPHKRPHDKLELASERHRRLALELLHWLRSRENPLVIVGVEIQRLGLQDLVKHIIKREGWKWAESLTAKDIMEENSWHVGLYAGSISTQGTRDAVESSDGVFMMGLPLSDVDSGMYTMNLDPVNLAELSMDRGLNWIHGDDCVGLTCKELLKIWTEETQALAMSPAREPTLDMDNEVKESDRDDAGEPPPKRKPERARLINELEGTCFNGKIDDSCAAMELGQETNRLLTGGAAEGMDIATASPRSSIFLFSPRSSYSVTVPTLTKKLEAILARHPNTVVLAETGDPFFAATEMHFPKPNRFLNNGYWASLGFALSGAIGAWFGTRKRSRPLVLIGDGAFLTSCTELATLVRYRIPAVVVIFDNRGYGTLRQLLDGPYNDVQPVNHVELAKGYGCRWARRVWSEKEVWESLEEIFMDKMSDGPMVLSVILDSRDMSTLFRNLCFEVKKRV